MTLIDTPEAPEHHRRFWLPPARSLELAATVAPNGVQLIGGAGLLVGWALEETTGAAVARVVIGDGTAAAVVRTIAPIRLAANESVRDLIPGKGLVFTDGLAAIVSAGTVAGALWVIMLTRDELDRIVATRTGHDRAGR